MLFKGLLMSLLSLSSVAVSPHQAASWYTSPEKGWLWYKRVPQEITREHKQTNASPEAARNDEIYTRQMETIRKNFEEIQAKAILQPTLDNVKQMQKAQQIIMSRATAFEQMWMLASLLSAETYRASDQDAPLHRKIYQEQTEHQLDQQIRALAKTHGLFFIFRNACPYCHEFAPVVSQLADGYGFNVKAISPDGQPLELFPQTVRDNGTIAQLNPQGIFPCLFLVNPQTRQVIPLARGAVSFSQLRQNFKVIIQSLGGKPYGQ